MTLPVNAAKAAQVEDWKSATRLAASLLVEMATANAGYPDACVSNLERNGPYIVLAPGVALVHAQISEGTSKGVAVLRLDTPVAFGHPVNDPVDLLLAFSSGGDHISMIQALGVSLQHGLAARLRKAVDVDAMISILREAVDHG